MTIATERVEAARAEQTLRARIIAASIELAETQGWSSVTMAQVADLVGVSRQTVYNEVGAKPHLAEAMVLDELSGFLAILDAAFEEWPDPVRAIRGSVMRILQHAEGHALVNEIVASSHGVDSELLPLLTTRSLSLVTVASERLRRHLAPHADHLSRRRLDALVDVIVRTVLSHVMQASGPPTSVADDLAWLAGRLLGQESDH
jgi:AcrR family transcriptional regulator